MKSSAQTNGNQIKVVLNHEDLPKKLPLKEVPIKKNQKNQMNQELSAIKELDKLVGLEKIKKLIYELYAFLRIRKLREEKGLTNTPHMFHMIFKGNPGTGKTTVARIFGKLFKEMGMLEKGHLVEVERADLVGEYIGHTAAKTREIIRKAMGGVLFVDEAYSLIRGGEKDFGKECIDTLIKSLEDNRNQLIVILAGYNEEMERFLASNPGLPSRFPITIEFEDYTLQELTDIAEAMCKEQSYVLTPDAKFLLRRHIEKEMREGMTLFSNARYVRNLIEKAIRRQAIRLLETPGLEDCSRDMLMELKGEDFSFQKTS
jgi:stage V sporulation protein K